jgi:hypothetical protein
VLVSSAPIKTQIIRGDLRPLEYFDLKTPPGSKIKYTPSTMVLVQANAPNLWIGPVMMIGSLAVGIPLILIILWNKSQGLYNRRY